MTAAAANAGLGIVSHPGSQVRRADLVAAGAVARGSAFTSAMTRAFSPEGTGCGAAVSGSGLATSWKALTSSRQTTHVARCARNASASAGSSAPRTYAAASAPHSLFSRHRLPLRHTTNPAGSPSAIRIFVNANRMRPFTVPAGNCSISAICVWLKPPKYASSTTCRCSAGSSWSFALT